MVAKVCEKQRTTKDCGMDKCKQCNVEIEREIRERESRAKGKNNMSAKSSMASQKRQHKIQENHNEPKKSSEQAKDKKAVIRPNMGSKEDMCTLEWHKISQVIASLEMMQRDPEFL
eukprot:10154059-Ditylum_brightwellii.AAC.2